MIEERSTWGAFASRTDEGLPERITPLTELSGRVVVVGVDLAIYVQLAYAPRNELRVLGAEVENQYFLLHICGVMLLAIWQKRLFRILRIPAWVNYERTCAPARRSNSRTKLAIVLSMT